MPDPADGVASPLLRSACMLTHQPKVADDHKPKGRFEIVWSYRSDRPVSIHEGFPHSGQFPTKGDFCPQENRQVISEISRTSVVEVEKHRFTSLIDTRIGAMAVSVTVSPCQIIECFNSHSSTLSDIFKIAKDLRLFHNSAIAHSRERPI